MKRELEIAVERAEECVSTWNMLAIGRLFQYPPVSGSAEFSKVAAVDLNIYPDFTECRPEVSVDENLVGSKLALATNGEDLLAMAPEVFTLFPYIFTSSLPSVPRKVKAYNTKYEAETVEQPLLRAYYGGCRVREVNTTGVYIEDTCNMSKHWESYGLMVHSPDDIPLCSTGDFCVHNYYNSNWEWVSYMDPERPDRVAINLNTFRSRYGDTIALSVLPGVVVMQMLLMGLISLYQVMSQKRSVLLTQIWAYRCQNGRMQVVYLAQITYHLIYNSDLYMIGLATGTLTTESTANLTCCFFAFSYLFINLSKARSGDQQLDRHFRLIWEAMEIVITVAVGSLLSSVQRTPLNATIERNAEILRKNTTRGAKLCGLHDSCVIFTVSMVILITLLSVALGLVAMLTSIIAKKMSPRVRSAVIPARLSIDNRQKNFASVQIFPSVSKVAAVDVGSPKQTSIPQPWHGEFTSFESNCLGSRFNKLFYDCDDIAQR